MVKIGANLVCSNMYIRAEARIVQILDDERRELCGKVQLVEDIIIILT
jgi:hypothetical protein